MARRKIVEGKLISNPVVFTSARGQNYCKWDLESKNELYTCICFDPEIFPVGKIEGDFWKGIVRWGGKAEDGAWYVEKQLGVQRKDAKPPEIQRELTEIEMLMDILGASYVTQVLKETVNVKISDGKVMQGHQFTKQYESALDRLRDEANKQA